MRKFTEDQINFVIQEWLRIYQPHGSIQYFYTEVVTAYVQRYNDPFFSPAEQPASEHRTSAWQPPPLEPQQQYGAANELHYNTQSQSYSNNGPRPTGHEYRPAEQPASEHRTSARRLSPLEPRQMYYAVNNIENTESQSYDLPPIRYGFMRSGTEYQGLGRDAPLDTPSIAVAGPSGNVAPAAVPRAVGGQDQGVTHETADSGEPDPKVPHNFNSFD
ncbi:hypothetical protein F5Y10DRAFT_292838 [Nemania abortiva]|nr:hypothetical protein F5Y10DRAFT_292838 [Nemania abortiva]